MILMPRSAASSICIDCSEGNAGASSHGAEAFASVGARSNALPPRPVGQIPTDRLAQPVAERMGRFPAEFAADLRGIDRIAQIMPGAIGHIGDELPPSADAQAGRELVEYVADFVHD